MHTSDMDFSTVYYKYFALSGVILAITMIKMYLTVTSGVCKSLRIMKGKTVIVTGANKGIGKETALGLAARGARVIMACRNMDRATAARDEIIEKTSNKNVVVHELDLTSLSSVRKFADVILATEDRLDVLINSAGVAYLGNEATGDNLQVEIQTNYLAPFLLTNLLTDLLKRSSPSRVVFLSSLMHWLATSNLTQLEYEPSTSDNVLKEIARYSFTKMANVAFANELAERLEGTGVTVNSLHPGAVVTDIFDHLPFWAHPFVWVCFKLFWKTPEQGAQTSIFLAVSEQVEGVTGKYFVDCQEAWSSSYARDKDYRKKIWKRTEEMLHTAELK